MYKCYNKLKEIVMDKEKIRNGLKNNFLKTLIFRVDFSGMMDVDVEDFIKVIRPQLINAGYITLQEEYGISDNILNLDNIQTNNETAKVYVFNSSTGKQIKISKTFIIFEINMEQNKTLFSNYVPLISYTLNELKKLQYVKFYKIGLKKVNVCILLNKKILNNYFKNNVLYRFREDSPITQVADEFLLRGYKVNYNRRFQEGKITDDSGDKPGYQIILVIDSFLEGYEILGEKITITDVSEILKELNNIIFEIYISSLTNKFISELSKDNYFDNNMKGVIKNG